MKQPLLSLIFLLTACFNSFSQSTKYEVKPYKYTAGVGTNWNTAEYKPFIINGLHFRLLYPKNFDATSDATKKYPLVILLHGIGENGDDNNLQLKFGGREHLNARDKGLYDGFVMVPQSKNDYFSSDQQLTITKFIEHAVSNLRVDEFRVHVAGYSAGGGATWNIANTYTNKITSAIPMSAASDVFAGYAQNLKYIAVWHTQGGRDKKPSPANGQNVADKFRAVGANYRYYFHRQLGHNTWSKTYQDPEYYKFLMNTTVLQVHAQGFKFNFCEGDALTGTLGVKQGFEGYQWKRNGIEISGATSNEYQFTESSLPVKYSAIITHNGVQYETEEITLKSVGPTPTPVIEVSGPTALPTLDGRSTVVLRGPANQQKYVWSNEATSDTLLISEAGSYSLSVTEPYGCPSAYSSPVKVTYNSVGVLPAPSNLTAGSKSETELSLKWTDNSTDETGFELYRSRTPDGPWVLAAQLPANSTAHEDNNLNTYTRYFYKLRAVNPDGGSTYADGTGKTMADKVAPTVPGGVEFYKTLRTSLGVKWLPSTDNADGDGTLMYEIYSGDQSTLIGKTDKTEYSIDNLTPLQTYSFVVRAVDRDGNKSAFSSRIYASTYANGLAYIYYEGEITSVYHIPGLAPVKKGMIPNFSIKETSRKDYFAYVYEGHINIPASGNYTFYTNSNNGSVLLIDGNEIVKNDWKGGGTASIEKSGTINLSAGFHDIKVLYYEHSGGGENLEVFWESAGITKQHIPNAAFTEEFTPPAPLNAPSDFKATAIDEKNIALTWIDESDNETGFEILRSTSNTDNFALAKLADANQTSYTDSELEAGTTYYYKIRAINATSQSEFAGLDAATGEWVNATTLGSSGGNSAPVLSTIGTIHAPYNITTTITIKAKDADGETLSVTATGLPPFATFTDHGDGTASMTLAPTEEQKGTYTGIVIQVNDAQGGTDSETISIIVEENTPPGIVRVSPVSLKENESQILEVMAYDVDGDKLTLSLVDAPAFLALTDNGDGTASIAITPRFGHAGSYTITLKATDAKGSATLATFEVFVMKVVTTYTVKVNLNNHYHEQAPEPWNNFRRSPSAGSMTVDLKDTEARSTYINLIVLDNFGVADAGAVTGDDTGVFPDAALKSYFYGWDDEVRRIRLSNLNPELTYKVTLIGSSIKAATSTAPTEYTIGHTSQTLATYNNTSNTVVFDKLKAPEKELVIGIRRTDVNQYSYINAMVIEAYYIDVTTPLTPTELAATRISTTAAELLWRDNATNETSYKIERSTDGITYTELASLEANTTSYQDATITADGTFYYRILASNANGNSAWSNVASLGEDGDGDGDNGDGDGDGDNGDGDGDGDNGDGDGDNTGAPVIANFPAVVVAFEGTETKIEFDLYDPDNDALELITRYMPHFARIEHDVERKKGIIIIDPSINDIGYYHGIQFTASDGVLENDVVFSISIKDGQKNSIYVNMGVNGTEIKPWNISSIAGTAKNKTLFSNLRDENDNLTGYSIYQVESWTRSAPWGEHTLNDTGIFPDVVTKSAYVAKNKTAVFEVRGLKADLRYNFVFFGSSVYDSKGGHTIYSINGQEVSLAVQSNIENTVQINGIKADASGKVSISVKGAGDATKGGFLNALIIEEYPENSPILRPSKLRAYAVSKTQVDLKWNDNSYQETGFEIRRRTLPDGEFELIATTAANATSYSDQGLTANTGYEYIVRAKEGNNFSTYSSPKQAATLQQFVYVNFNHNKDGNFEVKGNFWNNSYWNNTNKLPMENDNWTNLKNQDQQSTGINLQLKSFMEANPLGPIVKEGEGLYPSKAIQSFWFNEIGQNGLLRIYGLNTALTYNFRFFASSAFGEENGVTIYRIGTKYQPSAKQRSLDVQYNLWNTAVIRDVVPNERGEVFVEIEAGEFARYSYINAMVIESRDAFKEKNGASSTRIEEGTLAAIEDFNPEEQNQIATVYPNPTRGQLNVDFTAQQQGPAYLQVLDMTGRIIYSEKVQTRQGINTFSLDLRNPTISAGIYILKVKSMDFESKVIRFMKQ
jgi:predicted esterase/fibronectin type 3 domain-containing protein